MKICSSCKENKPLTEFSSKGNGKHTWCKPCVKEYDRKRYKENKDRIQDRNKNYREVLMAVERNLKETTPCTDCGLNFHHAIMEWDHLPQFKKAGAPYEFARQGSKVAFYEEIAKCELVCANCHRMRTFNRRTGSDNGRAAV